MSNPANHPTKGSNMKTPDLTRARRKLAQLKRRETVLTGYINLATVVYDWGNKPTTHEARRMAREFDRQIQAQDLKCRAAIMRSRGWRIIRYNDDFYLAEHGAHVRQEFVGKRALAHAVDYAEKMHKKEATT